MQHGKRAPILRTGTVSVLEFQYDNLKIASYFNISKLIQIFANSHQFLASWLRTGNKSARDVRSRKILTGSTNFTTSFIHVDPSLPPPVLIGLTGGGLGFSG